MNAPAWIAIADAVVASLLVVSAGFALVGAWALAKFADFDKRLHGPTKATTLGVGGALLASMLGFAALRGEVAVHEVLVAAFLFVTAPVSAHMLVRAAHRVAPDRAEQGGDADASSVRPN
jgi:multicomponent K+:H+ antiporter subunit G